MLQSCCDNLLANKLSEIADTGNAVIVALHARMLVLLVSLQLLFWLQAKPCLNRDAWRTPVQHACCASQSSRADMSYVVMLFLSLSAYISFVRRQQMNMHFELIMQLHQTTKRHLRRRPLSSAA